MLRVTNLTGFGARVAPPDTTPPTITSADHVTVDGGKVLAFSIVADEPVTLAIGGADAALFELVSTSLNTTHVLRWVGNGTQSHGAPADADADNVYEVTLTPTDVASNVGTPQNLAVTVDLDWVDAFSLALTGESSGWSNANLRQVILSSMLSAGGTKVRLTLGCPGVVGSTTLSSLYIGQRSATGDDWDAQVALPALTQLLVSGSGTISLPLDGDDVVTDALTFTIDATKNYVITAFASGGGSAGLPHQEHSPATSYVKYGADESSTADVSTYLTLGTNRVTMITKIEVAP